MRLLLNNCVQPVARMPHYGIQFAQHYFIHQPVNIYGIYRLRPQS